MLDAIIVLRFAGFSFQILVSGAFFQAFQPLIDGHLNSISLMFLVIILLPPSMAFSAHALIYGKKWGLRLNYYQFPLRFLIGCFSFGFLSALPLLPNLISGRLVLYVMIALEIARLITTIFIHYQTSKNQGWSSGPTDHPPAQPPANALKQTGPPPA